MNSAVLKTGYYFNRSKSRSGRDSWNLSKSSSGKHSWSKGKSRNGRVGSMSGSWNKNLGMIHGKTKSSSRDRSLS